MSPRVGYHSAGTWPLAAALLTLFAAQTNAGSPPPAPGLGPCPEGLCRGYDDAAGDNVIRRMVPGNNDEPVTTGRHPDVTHYRIGNWAPDDVFGDLFEGEYTATDFDEYLRIDLVFKGRINPPGPQEHGVTFDPFRYGNSPLYGSVEINADSNTNTGTELLNESKYLLGNVGRFGSRAPNGLGPRTATNWGDVVSPYQAPPQVHRVGSEFQIEFTGNEFIDADIDFIVGDSDLTFENNEIWEITGNFFCRSQGYEFLDHWAGLGCSQQSCREYCPVVTMRFQHRKHPCNSSYNETIVSLIFPLKNLNGELDDFDEFNDASIYEALSVPAFYTVWNLPTFNVEDDMLQSWMGHVPDEYMHARLYGLRMIFATAY